MARPMKAASPDGATTVSIRMPGTLRVRLEQEAAANHRTLSAESERRLERSFNAGAMLVDALGLTRADGDAPLRPEDVVLEVARAVYGAQNADIAMDLLNGLRATEMAGKTGSIVRMARARAHRLLDAVHGVTNDFFVVPSVGEAKGDHVEVNKFKSTGKLDKSKTKFEKHGR